MKNSSSLGLASSGRSLNSKGGKPTARVLSAGFQAPPVVADIVDSFEWSASENEAAAISRAVANLSSPAHLATATNASEVLSPLRYPGGKRRLAPFVAAVLQDNGRRPDLTVEPFAGGASVALYLLQQDLTQRIGLADRDSLIAAFWETVFFDTEWLIKEIGRVPVTLDQWLEFKSGKPRSRRSRAIACLYLNRTSFSGILAKSAGPIGGKTQTSKYKVGCRFPRATLQQRIRQIGEFRDRVAFVFEASWRDTLSAVNETTCLDGTHVFTYLDPPFFYKADKLYRFYFGDDEHLALRNNITDLSGDWLLSYDSVPRVAELYMNHTTLDLGAIYTASTAGGYKSVNEAVVSNLRLPRSNDPTSIIAAQVCVEDITNA